MNVLTIKSMVRDRDGYCCRECGMTQAEHIRRFGKALEVHRVVPGSPYAPTGCVTLCKSCHAGQPRGPVSRRPPEYWFGKRLYQLRTAAGMTRGQLAVLSGCNPRSIEAWEQGRSEPTVLVVLPLARALGVTAEVLLIEPTEDIPTPPRGRPPKSPPAAPPRRQKRE